MALTNKKTIKPAQQEHIGKRLRTARELAGCTQADLAERLGMCQSTLSRIEAQSDIRFTTLRQYIEGLGAVLQVSAQFHNPRRRSTDSSVSGTEIALFNDKQLLLPIFGDAFVRSTRDLIFSIKPQYSEKIELGVKTIELRRRFPDNIPSGTLAFIYSSSPKKALTGIAEIEEVFKSSPKEIWRKYSRAACIRKEDFDAYFDGTATGYAIKLRQARSLKQPVDLLDLRKRFDFAPPQSFGYATPQIRVALRNEFPKISD